MDREIAVELGTPGMADVAEERRSGLADPLVIAAWTLTLMISNHAIAMTAGKT